jgi:hypothetical protein
VIEPAFLATLRHQHRAEMVLCLVQLEQLIPGWWPDLHQLAILLGTDRSTLNRSISTLERRGLIRRTSLSNAGGTWIWWCKRFTDDTPNPDDEPAWIVRDMQQRKTERITIADRWAWGCRHNIPRNTLRSFLSGHQRIMRNRWRLMATPLDLVGGISQ